MRLSDGLTDDELWALVDFFRRWRVFRDSLQHCKKETS